MQVSSRLSIRQVLAVALFITLVSFGSPNLQAQKSHDDEGCGCRQKPAPPPPPVTQCCPQTLREKPTAPPAESCCPVDPKEVAKAQKESEHAQHEAAEACRRQQRAAAKAQRRIDEAYEKGTKNVEAANAKLETRKGESAEAIAKAQSLQAAQNEQVAAATPSTAGNEIIRSKPQPAPSCEPEPAPSCETPSTSEVVPPAAPAPAPEPAPAISQVITPTELPRTASPLELLGLIGLASSISGYVARRFRG